MALTSERLRSIIESMLLVSSEPLSITRMAEVIEAEDRGTDPAVVRKAVKDLIEDYSRSGRRLATGFRVEEVASGIQLRSTPENAAYLRRLLAVRPQRLTRAALETLAVIAYRQPVTKPEVESVRGVDIGAVLKALLDRDLIRILGKRDEVGRPLVYGTTTAFLELFGLKSLAALPTLREYTELDHDHQAEVDAMYEAAKPHISDLASKAEFLVERDDDPDLDALDEALIGAVEAGRATEVILNPPAEAAVAEAPAGEGAAKQVAATDSVTAAGDSNSTSPAEEVRDG